MNKSASPRRVILSLLCMATFLSTGFSSITEGYWERMLLKYGAMNLPVKNVMQSKYTSCGEAVIAMTYNYAFPETHITEHEVIEFAANRYYYTERRFPFTSPENMVKIAEHYSNTVRTGYVDDPDHALDFLIATLTGGDPVIIDVRTLLYDPKAGPHFVVVTGLEYDRDRPNATKIYFNDPLLKKKRWAYWLGREGIWDAWQNNGDPGGSGWWMVIYLP